MEVSPGQPVLSGGRQRACRLVGRSAAMLSACLPLRFHLAFKMAEISLVPLIEHRNVWAVFLQTLLRIAVVLFDAVLNDFCFTNPRGLISHIRL